MCQDTDLVNLVNPVHDLSFHLKLAASLAAARLASRAITP
jgi:hypothetical protein